MTEVTTILFIDLDATVMRNPFWTAVFPAISQTLSKATGLPAETIIKELIAENQRRLKHPPLDHALAMDWDDIVQSVARNHGVQFSPSVEDLVCQHSAPPYTSILDDAASTLRSLSQERRRKLVAASMGLGKYQFPVLHSLGLLEVFDDFLMPDLTGYLKTDRRFYSKYVQQINSFVFISIGDHYTDDILYPKSFGFHAVLKAPLSHLKVLSPFERPNHLSQFRDQIRGLPKVVSVLPDAVITELAELPNVIQQIEYGKCQC